MVRQWTLQSFLGRVLLAVLVATATTNALAVPTSGAASGYIPGTAITVSQSYSIEEELSLDPHPIRWYQASQIELQVARDKLVDYLLRDPTAASAGAGTEGRKGSAFALLGDLYAMHFFSYGDNEAGRLPEDKEKLLERSQKLHHRNFPLAANFWRTAASLGNSSAQHNLGTVLSSGLHFLFRLDQVELAYGKIALSSEAGRRAAAATLGKFAEFGGSPKAMMTLGYRHLYGRGRKKSCEIAQSYYQRAAAVAMSNLSPTGFRKYLRSFPRLSQELDGFGVTPYSEEDQKALFFKEVAEKNQNSFLAESVARVFMHGTFGSGQDLEAARNLLELSAQSNSPSALASLGDVYLFGLGVEKDYVKAYKLLDRAAKLGNAHADNELGLMYYYGLGVIPNKVKALQFFKKAAEAKHSDGLYNFGMMIAQTDPTSALQSLRSSAGQGHLRAQYQTALLTARIHGVTADNCQELTANFKNVAEFGPWRTDLELAARKFSDGDYYTAFYLYARAAEEGYEIAQSNAAFMIRQGLVPLAFNNSEEAEKAMLRWVSMSAEQGYNPSHVILGDWLYQREDYGPAIQEYLMASSKGSAEASFNAAYCFARGLGVSERREVEAKTYFERTIALNR